VKSFEYGDNEIGTRDVIFAVSNMVIGFGVLTLPRIITSMTKSSDGWISIVLGALIALGFAWMIAKLITRFPKQGFRDIMAAITNKAAANLTTLFFALYMLLYVSNEIRGVSSISKLYLFDKTPEEAICLFFLWVLAYGVAGTSVSLLRLNLLFLPVVLFIVAMVFAMNTIHFNYHKLKPFFITDWKDIIRSTEGTIFSFLGFEILLFYNVYLNKPYKTVKAVMSGLLIPAVLYIFLFVFVVGTFGAAVVQNTVYPTVELAKQVEIPGGFFERFESIFFVIWAMTLFNTAAMAFDVSLLALSSVFPKPKRMTFILFLCPIIYLVALQPQNIKEIDIFGHWISYMGLLIGWSVPALLLLIAKLRGVRGNV
jgi:spore germination protein